jgi:hypothetical protein
MERKRIYPAWRLDLNSHALIGITFVQTLAVQIIVKVEDIVIIHNLHPSANVATQMILLQIVLIPLQDALQK